MKQYKRAPLPFQGQKRYWHREIAKFARLIPRGSTVIDAFGGSGLVSHIIKYERPDLRVIWNDYDDYQRRLDLIPQTNAYLQEMSEILKDFPKNAHIEVGTPAHDALRAIFQRCREEGGDYPLLRKLVAFSSASNDRKDNVKFYCTMSGAMAYDATGYLEGVERVRMDWRELVASYPKDAVLVLDPPYLSTETSRYGDKQTGVYFGLSDHLDVMAAIQGRQYVLFTSNKSETVELAERLKSAFGIDLLGEGARVYQLGVSLSGTGNKYTDILITNLPEAPALPL